MAAGINRIRLEFKADGPAGVFLRIRVLIESDWNLKVLFDCSDVNPAHSINRIRLEFKVRYTP